MSKQQFLFTASMPGSSFTPVNQNLGLEMFQQNFTHNLESISFGSNLNVNIKLINQTLNNNFSIDQNTPKIQYFTSNDKHHSQIDRKRKKQKYKRSTNNSHKKFISALRRLFYAVLSNQQRDQFEQKYSDKKSSRTFFFIILAYMKYRFAPDVLESVKNNFIEEMKLKIKEYNGEAERTKNLNLKNFRKEEIIDIEYSIRSCIEYLKGRSYEAIEQMYKKDKTTVIKRGHFEEAVKEVRIIEKELQQDKRPLILAPQGDDYSNSSEMERMKKKEYKHELRMERLNQKSSVQIFPESKKDSLHNKPTGTGDEENVDKEDSMLDQEMEFLALNDDIGMLYPPLLEAIPFIKYDPFVPPFRYKRESRYRMDVREDFFGSMNYGFPKHYQPVRSFLNPYPQFGFSEGFPPGL